MSDDKAKVGERRPGGRAARVQASVLQATAELLTEIGYDALSIEAVAARAGVHKTTVYRRWPTKADLVGHTFRTHSEQNVPIPDSGSLAGDLQALARSVVANIGSDAGGRRARSIVAAAATSDELSAGMHEFWGERIEASSALIARAIERGELADDTDPNLIVETLIGPLWVRLLLTGEPLTNDLADHVAHLVAAGAVQSSD